MKLTVQEAATFIVHRSSFIDINLAEWPNVPTIFIRHSILILLFLQWKGFI